MVTSLLLIIALMAPGAAAPQQLPTGSIEGLVIRMGTSEPVEGAQIELTRAEIAAANPGAPPPQTFRASTAADGKFVLVNIPQGRYRLVATRPGGTLVPAEYGQRDPKGRGVTFELAQGQAMSGVRLMMAATSVISGRVFDTDRDPIPNARVLALEEVYQNGQRTLVTVQAVQTNDLGEYRLFWLRPGRYYVAALREDLRTFSFVVHVNAPDQFGAREDASTPVVREKLLDDGRSIEETSVLVYYGGGTDPLKAQPIDLAPGTMVSAVDVPMRAGVVESRRIRGSVTASNGGPASGALVRLVPVQASPHLLLPNGTTDKQGKFNIGGVIPGSYWLVAALGSSSGYSFSQSMLDVGNGTSSITRIEVADRDLEDVALVLKPAATLAGRLHVEGANNAKWDVTQAEISLIREPNRLGLPNMTELGASRSTQQRNGVPVEDGNFVLRGVAQGDYRVQVTGIPANAYVKAARLGAVDVLRSGLRIDEPPTAPLEIVVNLEGGTVEGVAVDEKSEPMSNATIALIPGLSPPGNTNLYKVATSDATGRFELKGITPGTYKVLGWQFVPAGIWQDPAFIRDFEVSGATITLSGGDRQQVRVIVSSESRRR